MKQCPKCSQLGPEDSFLCRCGYEFGDDEVIGIPAPAGASSSGPPPRQVFATGLGLVSLICVAVFFLSIALTLSELENTGFDAPPFYPGIIMVVGFFVTFPIALVCTIIALVLVGFSRSKLAWISLVAFSAPLILSGGIEIVLLFFRGH